MEQQGEIVSDYYMICVEQDSDSVWNTNNSDKDPGLLTSVMTAFMVDPTNKSNLPK
jgi:type VI secretion system secreted protein VgrG